MSKRNADSSSSSAGKNKRRKSSAVQDKLSLVATEVLTPWIAWLKQANAAVILGIRSPAALSKAVLEKKNYLAALELALKKHPDTTAQQISTVAKCKLEKLVNNRKAALKQTDASRIESEIETNNDPFDDDVGKIPDELLQVSNSSGHSNGDHKSELALARVAAAVAAAEQPKQFGVDVLAANPSLLQGAGRIGVVTNQACFSLSGQPTVDVVFQACLQTTKANVACVFGPQHGFFQTEQDNMLETPDSVYVYRARDPKTGASLGAGAKVPLFSLYSQNREPTAEQMNGIDTFVVDLQDIGCRVYTFMYTLALCIRAAAKHRKRVIVLDRPNPLGLCYPLPSAHGEQHSDSAHSSSSASAAAASSATSSGSSGSSSSASAMQIDSDGGAGKAGGRSSHSKSVQKHSNSSNNSNDHNRDDTAGLFWGHIAGNCMHPATRSSFVGFYDLPLQHGLTLGELGNLFMHRDGIAASDVGYTVIRVPNLTRHTPPRLIQQEWYGEHVYPFLPSPNMPSPATTDVFISMVSLEATNLSEGRGTTRPFRVVGAPWFDSELFVSFFTQIKQAFGTAPCGGVYGVSVVPYQFRPTFNKYAGQICNGVMIQVDYNKPRNMFSFGILLLLHCVLTHPFHFGWRHPFQGYEYDFRSFAIDLTLGHPVWRHYFDAIQQRSAEINAAQRPSQPYNKFAAWGLQGAPVSPPPLALTVPGSHDKSASGASLPASPASPSSPSAGAASADKSAGALSLMEDSEGDGDVTMVVKTESKHGSGSSGSSGSSGGSSAVAASDEFALQLSSEFAPSIANARTMGELGPAAVRELTKLLGRSLLEGSVWAARTRSFWLYSL